MFFHGSPPIGRTYRVSEAGHLGEPVTIIGVAGTSKHNTLRESPEAIIYVSQLQDSTPHGGATYLIGANGAASSVIPIVKSIVLAVDPHISLRFATLSDQIAGALQRE